MLSGANVILTARMGHVAGQVVRVARGVTDSAWCCYTARIKTDTPTKKETRNLYSLRQSADSNGQIRCCP
jgi:hypothetical protein